MSPPSWAYQVDNFNPPPDEELVCSICQAVFCDPVQSPCHHVFCRNCIAKWLESNRNCPICRKRTTRTTLQEVVPLVKNMIMKLTLNCHNSSRGCGEKFSLESCESHIKDCPFELVQCRNKPCNLMFMKRDLSDHEVNNCQHSFVRCTKCQLKMPSRKPKVHNCIAELQKKLKEKSEKIKKNNQTMKKLKEELRKLRSNDLYASVSSSADSLSPADVLFSFTENSNLFSNSSLSSSSAESEIEDDYIWPFPTPERLHAQIDFALEHMDDDVLSYRSPAAQSADESIEYPRSSSPLALDDSSVLVVEPAEPIIDDEPIRRPPKRRLNTTIFDSTDEEDEEVDSGPLPSRKRTWQLSPNAEGDSLEASGASVLGAAGPSYISSTTDGSSTSTTDSSPTSDRNKFKLKNKLRSRTAQRASARSAATASGTVASPNGSPIFERTISLLEQYNLESDPEWLPTHAEDSNESNDDIFVIPGHITSSDESSISELDSESSYVDAAEGRTEDLLNRFYGSSDSDSEDWEPQ